MITTRCPTVLRSSCRVLLVSTRIHFASLHGRGLVLSCPHFVPQGSFSPPSRDRSPLGDDPPSAFLPEVPQEVLVFHPSALPETPSVSVLSPSTPLLISVNPARVLRGPPCTQTSSFLLLFSLQLGLCVGFFFMSFSLIESFWLVNSPAGPRKYLALPPAPGLFFPLPPRLK